MKYRTLKDGEGIYLAKVRATKKTASHVRHRIACCDCGLVHDIVIVNGRDVFGFAAKRNERATAAIRRKKS